MIKKICVLAVTLLTVVPFIAQAETFNRQMQLGMSGADIGMLQSFLAKDSTLYPQGLVTNYYGFLTKSAVSNFQSRNGLPAVGRVGPATLPVLNAQYSGGASTSDDSASIISNVTVTTNSSSSNISWNTNESAKGVIYYSTSPLVTYERENSVDVNGNTVMTDASMRTYQNVALSNLQSNTTYYYMIYTTDQSGNVSVTSPSTFRTTN
jgi:peptidoglycan hydrolase-like protein with peptidoglycan-binding domain